MTFVQITKCKNAKMQKCKNRSSESHPSLIGDGRVASILDRRSKMQKDVRAETNARFQYAEREQVR